MNGSNTPILNQGSRGSIFVGWSYLQFQWFLKVEGGEKKRLEEHVLECLQV
jgi:hypothetical protein